MEWGDADIDLWTLEALSQDAQPPSTFASIDCDALLSGSNEVSATSSTTSSQAKQRRVVNRSRERRQNELRQLRAEAKALEAQLVALKQRRADMLSAYVTESGRVSDVVVVWEAIARHQFMSLKRARVEQAKLRGLRDKQDRIIRRLAMAFQSAESGTRREAEKAFNLVCPSTELTMIADAMSRRVVEAEQLVRLNALASQSQEAFSSSRHFGFVSHKRFLKTTLLQSSARQVVVEITNSWALPYSFDRVEDALWEFFTMTWGVDHERTWVQHTTPRGDALASVFKASSTIDRHRLIYDGRCVFKRMRDQEGRFLMTMHSFADPFCDSVSMESINVVEDGWLRVLNTDAASCGQPWAPLTIVQQVRRVHVVLESAAIDQSALDLRASLLTAQVQHEMSRGEQQLENMLFDKKTPPTQQTTPTH